MGGNDCLIPASQQTPGKFHAQRVGLLRCYLAGGKGMDDMIPQHTALFIPAALGVHHILIGGSQLAVDSGFQNRLADRAFLFIADIVQSGCKARLFRIQNIVDRVIQPYPDRDDFVIGHYTASRTSRHACCTKSDAAWISARVASPRALA